MIESKSWKITYPLRLVKSVLTRVVKLIKNRLKILNLRTQ